jgi:tubulin-specific chaperone A
MADSEASRSLSIKTGVVTRLHKELLWYEAETQKEAAKIESLRASGACPHDVKQQVRCFQSTTGPSSDTARRRCAGERGVRVRANGAGLPAAPAARAG